MSALKTKADRAVMRRPPGSTANSTPHVLDIHSQSRLLTEHCPATKETPTMTLPLRAHRPSTGSHIGQTAQMETR